MQPRKTICCEQGSKVETHHTSEVPLKVAAIPARQPAPAGERLFIPAQRRLAIAQRRTETLKHFSKLRKRHDALKAAQMVGSSVPTIWRWQKQFKARGVAGLMPRTARCGRRSQFEPICFSKEAVQELELLRIEHASSRTAWRQFANSPICPPLAASAVRSLGMAPNRYADIGRIVPVHARVFASTDGRRFYVKLSGKVILLAQAVVPAKFKFMRRQR